MDWKTVERAELVRQLRGRRIVHIWANLGHDGEQIHGAYVPSTAAAVRRALTHIPNTAKHKTAICRGQLYVATYDA